MNDDQLAALQDGFEPYDLLDTVGLVDALRRELGDDENGRPPELRMDRIDFVQVTRRIEVQKVGKNYYRNELLNLRLALGEAPAVFTGRYKHTLDSTWGDFKETATKRKVANLPTQAQIPAATLQNWKFRIPEWHWYFGARR